MAIQKVVVVDGNNLIVRIDRGVAGRSVTDVVPVEIDNALYLEFYFSDGTTETVGPVGTIQYIGASPIVVTGSTISLSTVPVNLGGTGQTTANAGFNALAPSQTGNSGKYLKTDGTNSSWDTLDISTGDITGTLPITNGGTGATTASGARTNLGLGTIATQDSSNVSITGGSITGITDLAVADGGTGASTASGARTNLGLGTISTQDASAVAITGGSITGITDLAIADGGTGASTSSGARTNLGLGTIATQDSSNVSITGGSITGITDLAIADGGTGASTASGARSNLGLGTAATLNAGVANGVATLDSGGTVPLSQIPASIQGGVSYQGSWNASTNTPTLTSSVGTKGYYYVVSVAGNTNLNGVTDWLPGDWAIFNGTAWEKIDNTDAVASVNGYTGVVVLSASDVGAPPTSRTISAGTGLSGGGDLSANRTISLANTAVTAGSYGSASSVGNFTVDGQGRLTAAASTTIAISNTQVSGLGTMSTQDANNVSITGGSISGITDLAIADGGTGASTASGARTNLGAAASGANSDITSMSGITGSISTVDYVAFDTTYTTALTAGQLGWDGNNTLGLGMAGGNVVQKIGEDQFYYIKATAAITKGQVVMFTGSVGASGVVTGAPAASVTDGSYIMGIAAESIAINGFGLIQFEGTLRGFDTSAFSDGDILWYNPSVTGGLTATKPNAPYIKVQMCAVINSGNAGNGSVLIRVSPGSVLGGTDSNVQFGTLANGNLIQYDSTLQYWKNVAPSDVSVTTFSGGTTGLTPSTATAGAVTLAGTLGIGNGGTGQTTANAAFNALAPDQTGNSGKYLTTDGSNTSWATNPLGTVTSVSGTGTVSGISLSGTVTTSGSLTLGGSLDLSAPPAIGGTTPAAGAFTTLSASSSLTLSGGTANGVLYLNGSKVATSGSALVFDGTNFGLGTSSPSAIGAGYPTLDIRGSTGGGQRWGNSTDSAYIYSNSNETNLATATNKPLLFSINAAEQMRLTSTGLGIGTSSPAYKLQVGGQALIGGYAGTGSYGLFLRSDAQSTHYNWKISTQDTVNGGFEIARSTAVGGTTFNSPYFVLDSSGNLGLGTSSPASKVHTLTAGTSGVFTPGITIQDNTYPNSGNPALRFETWGGGNNYYTGIAGIGYGSLGFYTTASYNSTPNLVATIDNGGNLGLGVTPSAWSTYTALQVKTASLWSGGSLNSFLSLTANAYYQGGYKYIASDYATEYYQYQGAHIWRTTASGTAGNAITFTQAMTLDASGFLSVGTTTARAQITAQSDLGVQNGLGVLNTGSSYGQGYQLIRFMNSAASYAGSISHTASTGIGLYSASDLILGSSSTERARIDSSGNFGIGTSSPSYPLHINQASGLASIGLTGGAANATNFRLMQGVVGVANSGFSIYDLTNSAIRFVIDASGNVGIGTSSPSFRLEAYDSDVSGARQTPKNVAAISAYNPSNPYTGFGAGLVFQSSDYRSSAPRVQARIRNKITDDSTNTTGSGIAFDVTATEGAALSEAMFLDPSGNLGLGVTPSAWNSSYKVLNIGDSGLVSSRTNTSINNIEIGVNWYRTSGGSFVYKANGYGTIYSQQDGAHYWYTAPSGTAGNAITFTQAMTLDASGNLLVGATSSTYSAAGRGVIEVNGSSNSLIAWKRNGSASAYLYATSGEFQVNNTEATPMTFYVNGSERARIDSDGNLLVGTTSTILASNRRLNVDGAAGGTIKGTGSGATALDIWQSNTSGNNPFIDFFTETSATARGSINYNRTAGLTAYNTTSDYRAKDIFGLIENSGSVIDSVPVYMGKMKGATQERPMFIAHETPEYAHTGEKDAVDENGNPVYQQMDASALIPVMWAEIQSLRKRLADAGIA